MSGRDDREGDDSTDTEERDRSRMATIRLETDKEIVHWIPYACLQMALSFLLMLFLLWLFTPLLAPMNEVVRTGVLIFGGLYMGTSVLKRMHRYKDKWDERNSRSSKST